MLKLGSVLVLALICGAAEGIQVSAADRAKRVKVFILAGQSNMEGQGIIAVDPNRNASNASKDSLEYLVKEPSTVARFAHLVDKNGKWVVRDEMCRSVCVKRRLNR